MTPYGKIILAIDPGASGGMAWGAAAGGEVQTLPMPKTEGEVVETLRQIVTKAGGAANLAAYVEQVGGFVRTEGGQPGSAMFKFGRGFGFLLGACAGLLIPVELTTPQRWQKGMAAGVRSGLSKAEWKRKLKAQAERLFPGLRVTLATADALLILAWARKVERGNP
jgi:hypothetical protein